MDIIIAVEYNWLYTKDDGESFKVYEVNRSYIKMGKCMRIEEIDTGGIRVWFDTGRVQEIFNVNSIYKVPNDDGLYGQKQSSNDKAG